MKFDSIISVLAMYLATGIGASYLPGEYTPSSYGMVKSPYNGEWEVIMIDENGQVQHPDSLPDWFNNGNFPGFPGQGQYPGNDQKPNIPCPSTPPTDKPEGEKPDDQKPPTEKPEDQYPPNQKPDGEYPPTEKPSNQYPGGGEKPISGGPARGSCVNIPAEPGMDIQKMLKLVNEARKGLTPLKLSEPLIKAAVWQSRNQQKMDQVSHSGPDGKGMATRMKECGLQGAAMMAENAAPGTTEEDVMKMWMESVAHRKNILNPTIREFGAARAGNYWTQTFSGSLY